MQKITFRPSFLSMICVAAVLITAVGVIIQFWPRESHSQPTYPQSDSSNHLFGQQLVVPVMSKDSAAVIELQGQVVTATNGNKYLVLGVIESATDGCHVVLMNYGKKVTCIEVLQWITAQAPLISPGEDR